MSNHLVARSTLACTWRDGLQHPQTRTKTIQPGLGIPYPRTFRGSRTTQKELARLPASSPNSVPARQVLYSTKTPVLEKLVREFEAVHIDNSCAQALGRGHYPMAFVAHTLAAVHNESYDRGHG